MEAATQTTGTRAEGAAVAAAGGSESAQVRAQLQLRELILSGELPGGARIAELALRRTAGV